MLQTTRTALIPLLLLASGLGACALDDSTMGNDPGPGGKVDDDADTASWIFTRWYRNDLEAEYLQHPSEGVGHIGVIACTDTVGACVFSYPTPTGGWRDAQVQFREVTPDSDGTCTPTTGLAGSLHVTVDSDGQGDTNYRYTYRWKYDCATERLAIGPNGAADEVLDQLHRTK